MSMLRLFSGRQVSGRQVSGRQVSGHQVSGREATAPIARERLQILLAHERSLRGQPDLLLQLREEILAVVSRHVVLDPDKVIVRMDRGKHVSTLEVDIELPNSGDQAIAAAG